MRAAVRERYGGPDVVSVRDVDRPRPGTGQLLVQVCATTVNRTDCGFRAASPPIVRLFSGLRRPKARILGCEFAGVVADIGPGVVTFGVGDRVFGYIEGPFGGHAEFVVVEEGASMATIPETRGLRAGRGRETEGSHYALAYLEAGRRRARHGLMVYGATGASAPLRCSSQAPGATVTGRVRDGTGRPGRRTRCRPGDRLHHRGLHAGRTAVRRRARRGGEEHLRGRADRC